VSGDQGHQPDPGRVAEGLEDAGQAFGGGGVEDAAGDGAAAGSHIIDQGHSGCGHVLSLPRALTAVDTQFILNASSSVDQRM